MAEAAGVGYAPGRHPEGKAQAWATSPGRAAVTMYPDDATLIARGKHSTLTKERRAQIRRVQDVCSTIVTAAQATLRDCEEMPPVNIKPIETIDRCIENLKDARVRLVELATNINDLRPQAWPE